jgi:hypothetical protein
MKNCITCLSIFTFLSLFTSKLTAQEILLEQEVTQDTTVDKKGPNKNRFFHFYTGYGFMVDEGETGAEVKPFSSHQFTVGFRQKFKLSKIFSFGYDIAYSNDIYRLKQNASKVLPNNITHLKETIRLSNLGASLFLRTNFKKNRGNVVGNFLDLGFGANWIYKAVHQFTDDFNVPSYNAGRADVTLSELKYVEALSYGPIARIGFNRIALYGQYRLNPIFKSSYNYPDVSKIVAGVQIGLH